MSLFITRYWRKAKRPAEKFCSLASLAGQTDALHRPPSSGGPSGTKSPQHARWAPFPAACQNSPSTFQVGWAGGVVKGPILPVVPGVEIGAPVIHLLGRLPFFVFILFRSLDLCAKLFKMHLRSSLPRGLPLNRCSMHV